MTEFLKEISTAVYQWLESDFLVSFFIKSSVIVFSAFVIQLVLRNYTSAVKHRVWNFSLIAILFVPIMPDGNSSFELDLYQQQAFITESPITESTVSAIENGSKVLPVKDPQSIASQPAIISLSFLNWATIIWLAGVVFLMALLFREVIWLWILLYNGFKTSNLAAGILRNCKAQIGLKRKVYIIFSKQINAPLTFGFFFPIIILPDDAGTWEEEKLKIVFLHELIHIKRNDYLTNLTASLSVILCWYNPLTWLALHRQKVECEKACDENVLENNINPGVYATELLKIAEEKYVAKKFQINPIVSILGATSLKHRIKSIIGQHAKKRTLPYSLAIVLSIFLFFEAVSLSSVKFYSEKVPESVLLLADEVGLNELLTLIKSPGQEIRKETAQWLMAVNNPAIIAPILDQLDVETDNQVKAKLIAAVAKFGDSREFYRVAQHINSNDTEVKIQVLEYMKIISCFPSYLVVEASQNDPDPEVASMAKSLLSAFYEDKLKRSIKNFAVNFKYNNDLSLVIAKKMSRISGFQVIDNIRDVLESEDASQKRDLGEKLLTIASSGDFGQLKDIINKIK